MKAIQFRQHGGPEEIELVDIPVPQPADNECLIKIAAVSLNGFDPMVLRGIPGVNTPPAKAGGFKLRLKAGLVDHTVDYTT